MFGGFGQASQQSQQPLFGQAVQPAQNQPSALNLFGSSTQTSQPSLFGSGTATSQPSLFGQPGSTATSAVSTGLFGSTPASQPASTGLFGSTSVAQPASTGLFGATSIAQPASTGLFGSTPASQPASTGLFGATSIAQPASTGLFGGGSSTPGQLGSLGTSPGSLLTSTPQPKTPLFGQTSTPNASTTPLSLFGGQPTQTQTPLFGSNLGSTSQAPVGLFSGTASTQPQQNTMNPIATTPFTGKNSPLEQEVPQQLINLLDILRDTVKKNFEYTPKSSLAQAETNDLNELMTNAEYYMGVVKKSSKDASLDAKGFIEKATGDVCKCKDLIEINKQRKLHPSQASEQLCHLLCNVGEDLHSKINKLNDKVYELEAPLRQYSNWKDNGMESQIVGREELLEHVGRMVEICNVVHMNATSVSNKIELLKVLYTNYLKQLHGKYTKSPFKPQETSVKSSDLFEYDPQRGMKAPNIFPSTTALLSLVGTMSRNVGVVQQQPTFGSSFSQPQSTSFFGAQRPAPFSLGAPPPSTPGSTLGTSLFNKPLTAAAPTTTSATPSLFSSTTSNASKPAFQLPSLNVSTPSFGSTLNSSSSGTLFSGSVRPPNLFGAK